MSKSGSKKSKKKKKTRNKGKGPRRRVVSPGEALSIALRMHRTGRLDEAEQIYRELHKGFPDSPDVLHFLGLLCHQQGKTEESLSLISKAVEIQPEYVDARNNLGNVLQTEGRSAEAEEHYREVIRLRPDHTDAYNNLGIVTRRQGRHVEAEAACRKAIELDPTHADAYHNLGTVLRKIGRTDEATEAYRKSLEIRPGNPKTYEALARMFRRARDYDGARQVYERWLEFDPKNPIAQHMATATAGGMVARASDDYVRSTFDLFAPSFDTVLEKLEYRAPRLIVETIERDAGPPEGRLDVLDAGCGTGLCGPLLRPYAKRLDGIDLSPRMLDRARERKTYDDLVAGELVEFMNGRTADYDLIVSADTLVYFGDLQPVCSAAAFALRAGGSFAFTLEEARADASEGYRLEHHGRYAHTESYVRAALEAAGLEVGSVGKETLRLEGGEPVPGLVVLARAPEPDPGA